MSKDLYQWRKKVLDSVSPSFCAAKWLNASIHLGHGYTHSCHLPIPHPIDEKALKDNPSAIHNTEHKKKQRQKMLTGVRPAECEYCWKIEDIGRENISDRVYKSKIYSQEDIDFIAKQDPSKDIIPRTLEISFDRVCNFACSYCNAGYSTTWGKDIKTNGAYQNMTTDGAGAYHNTGEWAEPYGPLNKGNPYVEAFFNWWPTLSEKLQELRVTGGEPMMGNGLWRLLESMSTQHLPHMRFAVNSNLGIKDELLTKLIAATHKLDVKSFDLYTSCEAFGDQADYLRDGLHYATWRKNLIRFIENANFRSVTIMMTLPSLALFSITDFMDDMMTVKKKFGHNKPLLDLNILRWPSFMSPLAMPDHIKDHCRKKLEKWLELNKHNEHLGDGEIAQIKRLIDYIETVDKPHRRTTEDKLKLQQDFKSFYQQYDVRRNKNLETTFPPILTDWLKDIEIQKASAKTINSKISNYED